MVETVSRETTPELNFSGLTPSQQQLLTFQGWEPKWGQPLKQPHAKTVEKLLQRGLVVERVVRFAGIAIKAYDVPVSVHAALCAWCSQRESARA